MNSDQLLHEALERARAAAWDAGFHAGQTYGAELQKFDPQWDHAYDEPTRSENPYTVEMGGRLNVAIKPRRQASD